ncbi:Tryptophan synthase alpha chain [uncultured archaeon]|nr:Tryptophan synthase alpha chain [uncultured archaeon]
MTFVPYICFGDPGTGFSSRLVKALAPYSSLMEIGIPFSDPIADGKAIQGASQRALKHGATPAKALEFVAALRKDGIAVPIAFMTYYNIIFKFGKERFLAGMKEAGAQALIIPDLPFAEDPEFEKMAARHGIEIIWLVAQNTPPERAKEIIASQGKSGFSFTYLVSAKGTTGARGDVGEESLEFVKRMRKLAGNGKKLFVGFGVSNAEQAKAYLEAGADGVIVGSEIINIYSKFIGPDGDIDMEGAVGAAMGFAGKMAKATGK